MIILRLRQTILNKFWVNKDERFDQNALYVTAFICKSDSVSQLVCLFLWGGSWNLFKFIMMLYDLIYIKLRKNFIWYLKPLTWLISILFSSKNLFQKYYGKELYYYWYTYAFQIHFHILCVTRGRSTPYQVSIPGGDRHFTHL